MYHRLSNIDLPKKTRNVIFPAISVIITIQQMRFSHTTMTKTINIGFNCTKIDNPPNSTNLVTFHLFVHWLFELSQMYNNLTHGIQTEILPKIWKITYSHFPAQNHVIIRKKRREKRKLNAVCQIRSKKNRLSNANTFSHFFRLLGIKLSHFSY